MEEQHKRKIKKLLNDDNFDALAAFYQMFIAKKRTENVIGKDNGETLKLTLMKEGGILTIEEFFNNLEKEIYD